MDKTWHGNHFSCHTCDKQFSAETGYHEHDGKPYCEPCYSDVALPKCKGCGKPIKDKAIKALNSDWHLSCFVCKVNSGETQQDRWACPCADKKSSFGAAQALKWD